MGTLAGSRGRVTKKERRTNGKEKREEKGKETDILLFPFLLDHLHRNQLLPYQRTWCQQTPSSLTSYPLLLVSSRLFSSLPTFSDPSTRPNYHHLQLISSQELSESIQKRPQTSRPKCPPNPKPRQS